MQNSIDLSAIQQLPMHIRRLVPKLENKRTPFSQMNQNNAEKVANYVRTKTLMDLLKTPPLEDRNIIKGEKPVILVFCQASDGIYTSEKGQIYPYASLAYVEWLQGAGAHCIPVAYNINDGSLHFLLERAHGLLIPGGNLSNLFKNVESREGNGPMTAGVLKMMRIIQKMWSKGINFPIWGTCLGLQAMLIALTGDSKILSRLNHRGYQTQIFPDYQNSKLLKKMPLDMRLHLQNRKLLHFFHNNGISVKKFMNTPKLMEKLKITAISKDHDGKWFCALMQGKDKPIFLCQLHPEKQGYHWPDRKDILHHKYPIELSHYLAQSFIRECLKCKNQKLFHSLAEQQFYMFQQFRQVFHYDKYKIYVIDYKFRQYDKEHKKRISEKQIESSQKKIFI